MNKKIEKAVDEILILYCSGMPVADAINKVLEKLKSKEQYKLIELLQKTLDRRN